MNNKIIELYCLNVIKPLELRKKELEKELRTNQFISRKNKKELELVSNLFFEKLDYLTKIMEKINIDS